MGTAELRGPWRLGARMWSAGAEDSAPGGQRPRPARGAQGRGLEAWPPRHWPHALLSAGSAEAPSHPARSKRQATGSPGASVVCGLCMYNTGPWPGRPGWNPLPSPTQTKPCRGVSTYHPLHTPSGPLCSCGFLKGCKGRAFQGPSDREPFQGRKRTELPPF